MKNRALGRTGMMISEIGLGCEHLEGLELDAVQDVVDAALAGGINYMDIFMSEPNVRSNLGMALQGRREDVMLQGHIGSIWQDGQYRRSRNLEECREGFSDLLNRLRTDYIDVGMIHYVDTEEDFHRVFDTGLIEYAMDLKEKGIIRALGMSSHHPLTAKMAVETGLLDVLMFSINPAYDILPENSSLDDLFSAESYQRQGVCGMVPGREGLYQLCEASGTGITVMKGLAAGTLLSADSSPFGRALTPVQCAHYALTRPGVSSILVGCRNRSEVEQAIGYETASAEERDYSEILSKTPLFSMQGKCMYCNHCLPCPSRIDIAAVNQFLDLATAGRNLEDGKRFVEEVSDSVRGHYEALAAHGSDCIGCGNCEANCPFGVSVISRMAKAVEVFGY